MTNSFSLSRLYAYSKAELFLHRVEIIRAFVVVLGIAILVSLWNTLFHIELFNGYMVRPLIPHCACYAGMIVVAAGAFKIFQKPGGGTFAMQIPASTLEKYTARFILNIIILPLLATFIPRVVWDICHASFASHHPMLIGTYSYIWTTWIILVFIQSTFFLGATIWRKQQLLKVLASWIAVAIVISSGVYIAQELFHVKYSDVYPIIKFLSSNSTYIASALTLVFLVLSWVRFRKFQILK